MKKSSRIASVAAALLLGWSSAAFAGLFAITPAKFEKQSSSGVNIVSAQLFEKSEGALVTGYVNLSNPSMEHYIGHINYRVLDPAGQVVEQGSAELLPHMLSKFSRARFEGNLAHLPDKDATIVLSYED